MNKPNETRWPLGLTMAACLLLMLPGCSKKPPGADQGKTVPSSRNTQKSAGTPSSHTTLPTQADTVDGKLSPASDDGLNEATIGMSVMNPGVPQPHTPAQHPAQPNDLVDAP